MRRVWPFLLIAFLLLVTGIGAGIGLSEAPTHTGSALPRPVTTSMGAGTASRRPPQWLLGAVSRQLAACPIIDKVRPAGPIGRTREEVRYAETTWQKAWYAIGEPYDAVREESSNVWLAVVTGPRDYEDIGGFTTTGLTIPSGTTVEFGFDTSGKLAMTSASNDPERQRRVSSVFSDPAVKFSSAHPLPAQPSPSVGQQMPLTEEGQAGFGSCPVTTTEMTATTNGRTFAQDHWFVVNVTATNVSKQACTFTATESDQESQEVGPCGAIYMSVVNSAGVVIWPGQEYVCPAEGLDTLRPGHHIQASGIWNLATADGALVPPGEYMVVVARTFSFNISVG